MATVKDVAAYILRTSGPMSAMKLQKLVYYSQAWSLAIRGKRLFVEQVQAWAHGPVVYELFEMHRGQYAVSRLPADSQELVAEDRRHVDRVLGHYARMTADALSKLTHAEGPWLTARAGVPEGERASAVITAEAMGKFYATQPAPFRD